MPQVLALFVKNTPRLRAAFSEYAFCQIHVLFTLTKALVLGLLWNVVSARGKTLPCTWTCKLRVHNTEVYPSLSAVLTRKAWPSSLHVSCLPLYWLAVDRELIPKALKHLLEWEGTGRHYTLIVHITYKGNNAPDSKILGKHRGNRDFTPRNMVGLAPDNKLRYRWNQGLNKKWEERRALCKGISQKQINSPTAIDTSPKAVNALFLLSQLLLHPPMEQAVVFTRKGLVHTNGCPGWRLLSSSYIISPSLAILPTCM